MSKYRCTVCGYVHEGELADDFICPVCKQPASVFELKAGKDCTEGQLDEFAETALKQINDRQYHVEMSARGVKEILQYGIAFSGKSACVRAEIKM